MPSVPNACAISAGWCKSQDSAQTMSVPKKETHLSQVSKVPFPCNHFFPGREEVLEHIHILFSSLLSHLVAHTSTSSSCDLLPG